MFNLGSYQPTVVANELRGGGRRAHRCRHIGIDHVWRWGERCPVCPC